MPEGTARSVIGGLREHAGQVVVQALIARTLEDLLRLAVLHHVAHIEERRSVGGAARLLHVVRHDDYGAVGNCLLYTSDAADEL